MKGHGPGRGPRGRPSAPAGQSPPYGPYYGGAGWYPLYGPGYPPPDLSARPRPGRGAGPDPAAPSPSPAASGRTWVGKDRRPPGDVRPPHNPEPRRPPAHSAAWPADRPDTRTRPAGTAQRPSDGGKAGGLQSTLQRPRGAAAAHLWTPAPTPGPQTPGPGPGPLVAPFAPEPYHSPGSASARAARAPSGYGACDLCRKVEWVLHAFHGLVGSEEQFWRLLQPGAVVDMEAEDEFTLTHYCLHSTLRLHEFAASGRDALTLPAANTARRALLHGLAELHGVDHYSTGTGANRAVTLGRPAGGSAGLAAPLTSWRVQRVIQSGLRNKANPVSRGELAELQLQVWGRLYEAYPGLPGRVIPKQTCHSRPAGISGLVKNQSYKIYLPHSLPDVSRNLLRSIVGPSHV